MRKADVHDASFLGVDVLWECSGTAWYGRAVSLKGTVIEVPQDEVEKLPGSQWASSWDSAVVELSNGEVSLRMVHQLMPIGIGIIVKSEGTRESVFLDELFVDGVAYVSVRRDVLLFHSRFGEVGKPVPEQGAPAERVHDLHHSAVKHENVVRTIFDEATVDITVWQIFQGNGDLLSAVKPNLPQSVRKSRGGEILIIDKASLHQFSDDAVNLSHCLLWRNQC